MKVQCDCHLTSYISHCIPSSELNSFTEGDNHIAYVQQILAHFYFVSWWLNTVYSCGKCRGCQC